MDPSSPWVALPAASVLTYLVFHAVSRRKLPPGPRAIPILGNVHQMPKEREWYEFAKWAEEYGDCTYVHALGQPIVILNSLKAAQAILRDHSAIHSSRPRLVMAGDLVGFDQALALMPYSPRFHDIRQLLHKELTGNAIKKYYPLFEEEAQSLIRSAIQNPTQLQNLVRHYAGSVILKVTYGYQTAAQDDRFLVLAEKVMAAFSQASQPGAWLVDIVPWVRHLPDWVPGTHFKKVAQSWTQLHLDVIEGPYNWAKEHQDSPSLTKPNFTSTVLAQSDYTLAGNEDEVLLWASASLFGGGADTTVSAIKSFFLAMALYPEVQRRGQEEIDKVIGRNRLPAVDDRPSLPYIECIMKEVLRWRPIVPLCVPHASTGEDTYKGYRIPKGTIVIPNIWSMLHDPTIFPSPEDFIPGRFSDNQEALDTLKVAFGFGRRLCPGINFAESSMFAAMATALATCNISDAVDDTGTPIQTNVQYDTGTISHPPSFSCKIAPRTELSTELLQVGARI